jgi:hypothetical protein
VLAPESGGVGFSAKNHKVAAFCFSFVDGICYNRANTKNNKRRNNGVTMWGT